MKSVLIYAVLKLKLLIIRFASVVGTNKPTRNCFRNKPSVSASEISGHSDLISAQKPIGYLIQEFHTASQKGRITMSTRSGHHYLTTQGPTRLIPVHLSFYKFKPARHSVVTAPSQPNEVAFPCKNHTTVLASPVVPVWFWHHAQPELSHALPPRPSLRKSSVRKRLRAASSRPAWRLRRVSRLPRFPEKSRLRRLRPLGPAHKGSIGGLVRSARG